MKKYFYPGPTQVQYFLSDSWSKGIAFCDFIIDLYNGQPYLIDLIYREAEKMGISEEAAIVEKCEWIDFLKFING